MIFDPGQDLDRLDVWAVAGDRAVVVPVSAGQVGEQLGVTRVGFSTAMTHTLPKAAGDGRLASVEPLDARAALDYEAPFVIEKLLKDHVADTADEAQELFAKVKRYLVLHEIDRTF